MNLFTNNPILKVDSYKTSHYKQYPPNTTEVSSYVEARKGDEVVFFGLQGFLKGLRPVTMADVSEAERIFKAHGVPFNRDGWVDIIAKNGGKLPLEIQAIPEGTVVPGGTVMVQVRNTLGSAFWLPSYIETTMLRSVWYPSTVATNSRRVKKIILEFLKKTADSPKDEIDFKLHDFGARGVSSGESAALGGAAHLVNFKGTDTIEAIPYIFAAYNTTEMPGFSIPAAEHSTATAWGKDAEGDFYSHMLKAYPNSPIIAVVSDTYDIYNACKNLWGGLLKEKVERLGNDGRMLVIRPDSGNPVDVVMQVLRILFDRFGYKNNKKGYKVLPKFLRIIQGDGVNEESITEILTAMEKEKFSASNITFGMGGALLQKCDRDTYSFAQKACEVVKAGKSYEIFKQPFTDIGKASKKGRQAVILRNKIPVSRPEKEGKTGNLLKTVWKNGEFVIQHTFEEIRARAAVK